MVPVTCLPSRWLCWRDGINRLAFPSKAVQMSVAGVLRRAKLDGREFFPNEKVLCCCALYHGISSSFSSSQVPRSEFCSFVLHLAVIDCRLISNVHCGLEVISGAFNLLPNHTQNTWEGCMLTTCDSHAEPQIIFLYCVVHCGLAMSIFYSISINSLFKSIFS